MAFYQMTVGVDVVLLNVDLDRLQLPTQTDQHNM
jgi:hypothetical protein